MNTNEEVIRQLAHQLWEAEGKPDGQSVRHWEQARIRATAAEEPNQAGPKKSIDPSEKPGPTEPAQPDQT